MVYLTRHHPRLVGRAKTGFTSAPAVAGLQRNAELPKKLGGRDMHGTRSSTAETAKKATGDSVISISPIAPGRNEISLKFTVSVKSPISGHRPIQRHVPRK
jgi:hypothetical protein